MTLLAAKAFDFSHCQARHATFSERFTDFFEFERLENSGDLFHGFVFEIYVQVQALNLLVIG